MSSDNSTVEVAVEPCINREPHGPHTWRFDLAPHGEYRCPGVETPRHFVWCDPPRCTTPDPGEFPRAAVHRSREIPVKLHGGQSLMSLYATERSTEVQVVFATMCMTLAELRRAVAELESLTQPRTGEPQ